MALTSTPTVGAIGLVKINGTAGRLIRIGQWLAGGGYADYEHAFITTQINQTGSVYAVEAEPRGATDQGLYVPADGVLYSNLPLTDEQRQAIVEAANKYVGTPYSFLDYFALAAHKFHIPVPFLKRYISSTRHLICSQLVDKVYADAGIHLFNDNRWPGFVAPSDLYRLFAEGKQDERT